MGTNLIVCLFFSILLLHLQIPSFPLQSCNKEINIKLQRYPGAFIANSEQISHIVLDFLLLHLNEQVNVAWLNPSKIINKFISKK